ncbi:MAG TPA: ABC transporter permease [Blastocatellia bacterium]|nr:ABC transporter permease [Blastocatellia bacterium]
MEVLLKDIRYGLRMLLKKPGFTAVAIIALALGIGANTAIFSVVDTVLLRPLPYDTPDELVWIWETNLPSDIKTEPASPPNYLDWKSQNQVFEEMMAFATTKPILSSGGEPERVTAGVVTAGFFSVLRAQPALGRTFVADEEKQGNNRVVVLGHGLWQRRFGSDPEIIDKPIILNGNPYVVVGVMPPGFQHPKPNVSQPPEMWMPLVPTAYAARRGDFLNVIARTKPGVTVEQARAEMNVIASGLEQQYPATNANWGVTVLPLHDMFVGDVRLMISILAGAVGFLLLIACANVANLLLTRAASRQKEVAIRVAMGANRARLVRQLLTESLMLALAGGALGSLLALWGVDAMKALNPGNIPRLQETGIDWRVLSFTFAVSVLTGIIFGLLPALQASNPNLTSSLKEGDRGSTEGFRGRRMRSALVVAEVALSLVLLVGAGLMIQSFLRLQKVDPGFNAGQMLTLELSLPAPKYKGTQEVIAFYDRLLEAVPQTPGVEETALIDHLPMTDNANMLGFSIQGRPQAPDDPVMDAETYTVSPSYFKAMNIQLVSGRLFTQFDKWGAQEEAVVVNETFVRRFFPGEDPLGKRVTFGNPDAPDAQWASIVGVVKDIRHMKLDIAPYPQMYVTYAQGTPRALALMVRTSGDPMSFLPAVRNHIWSLDKEQPIYNVRTMEQLMAASIARPGFNTLLFSIFAGVALVLAAVGIYGVISYSVTQRTHEIGIRMALGARHGDVLKMVVRQGMVMAMIGVAIGLLAAIALARFISSLLFNVSATDPLTYVGIALLFAGIALLACYIPARRATRVDPMIALRYE